MQVKLRFKAESPADFALLAQMFSLAASETTESPFGKVTAAEETPAEAPIAETLVEKAPSPAKTKRWRSPADRETPVTEAPAPAKRKPYEPAAEPEAPVTEDPAPESAPVEAPKTKAPVAETPETPEAPAEPIEGERVTVAMLRQTVTALLEAGKRDAVAAVLAKHTPEGEKPSVSALKESSYAAAYNDLKAL